MKFIKSSSTQSVVRRYRGVTLALALLAVVAANLTVQAENSTTTTVFCSSPVVVGQGGSCGATVADTGSPGPGKTTPTGTVTFSTSGPGALVFSPSNTCALSEIGPGVAAWAGFTPSRTSRLGSGSLPAAH